MNWIEKERQCTVVFVCEHKGERVMLRLNIDGNWEPEDFIEIFESIESLYYKAAMESRRLYTSDLYYSERAGLYGTFEGRDSRLRRVNRSLLADARTLMPGDQRLYVLEVAYASPGKIDLLGVGQAVKSIDRTLGRLIKLFTERRIRIEGDKQAELDTSLKAVALEKERESLRAIKIQNAKEILTIRREYSLDENDVMTQLLVEDQDRLIPLIAQGKLTGSIQISSDPRRKSTS